MDHVALEVDMTSAPEQVAPGTGTTQSMDHVALEVDMALFPGNGRIGVDLTWLIGLREVSVRGFLGKKFGCSRR